MQRSSTEDWVFLIDNATATTNRRINFYKYDKTLNIFEWQGFVTATPPPGTNHTARGFRMTYDAYTTGTVGVSGTAVTGSGTAWQTARFAAGARIGFGSTTATSITTWYEIASIDSDTGITLSTDAGTVSAGSTFIIEELRGILLTTASVTTSGGLFIVKGLNPGAFSPIGITIAAATTVDNMRATYWIKDAATETNITGSGLAIETKVSDTEHYVWALNGTSTMRLFKYNLRAALTLTTGADTANGIVFSTGTTGTLTGTASQINNGRNANLAHGPGAGVDCIYFTTTTRIYRTNALSTITTGSTTFLADSANEIPPGGASTFAATNVLQSIESSGSLDKLIVLSSGASGARSYITNYYTDGSQWDRIFLVDNKQIDQSLADSNATPMPSILARAFSCWSEGGVLYLAGIGTTAALNLLYAIPMSADWQYTSSTNSRLVTPVFSTPNVDSFVRLNTNAINVLGGCNRARNWRKS